MKSTITPILVLLFFGHLYVDNAFNPNDQPYEQLEISPKNSIVLQPYDFDVTISLGVIEITYHVHCDNEIELLTWISTNGALGCESARSMFNPNSGDDSTEKFSDRKNLIRAIEKAMGMKGGTLKYIDVKDSSEIIYKKRAYKIKPGKYRVERKANYPLDFKFELIKAKG